MSEGMDAYRDLLRGVHADGARLDRLTLSAPWSLDLPGAPITLVTPVNGGAWVVPGDGEPRRLLRGDTAVVRGPGGFVLTDTVGAVPAAPGGTADIVVGAYRTASDVGHRLLGALPRVLTVPDCDCGVLAESIAAEVSAADRAGQPYVLDKLLDWLLVCTLRDWFDRPDARPPAWYRALGDEVVGPAMRAVHDAPGRPWTTAGLAALAGASRTAFTRRFTALVGEPPMAYLTGWRMELAAELLTDPDATVAAVARRVGYADAFAFSAAFKRVCGVSPSAHRGARAAV
jgi:AraC-like DNA-binding protein|uniref:AraC family transcriptional regulator n=1 Tax=Nocardiopsis trehalosi TaxID=109329 RepID=UPI001FE1510F|nr:AraC family transcriptional regulator [Nocardiopsis trehalosi]